MQVQQAMQMNQSAAYYQVNTSMSPADATMATAPPPPPPPPQPAVPRPGSSGLAQREKLVDTSQRQWTMASNTFGATRPMRGTRSSGTPIVPPQA